jgi:hypothetical protein
MLERMKLRKARLLSIEDLEDDELIAVRAERPRREFCWTCAGPLLRWMLRQLAPGEVAAYLDADLVFFSDPQPIYDELGDGEIIIHEHRFAPRYAAHVSSGVFNVGFVGIRNAPEGRACIERWRRQCLDLCVYDPERGLCGDQHYLNEWPSLYPSLVVLQHKGAGLAPWNVERYTLSLRDGRPFVDDQPLIFYHYHALRILFENVFGRSVVLPSAGYSLTAQQRQLVYRPYVRLLREAMDAVRALGETPVRLPGRSVFRDLYAYSRRRQLVWA